MRSSCGGCGDGALPRPKYLRIRNWDRYQHYHDRKPGWHPPWVKLYVDLLSDYHFGRLSTDAKWTFVALMLKAAQSENLIDADATWLAPRLYLTIRATEESVNALVRNGFIERCKRPCSREALDDVL